MTTNREPTAERFEHALGNLLGFHCGNVVADDHELVATESRHRVARTDCVGDTRGRVAQKIVARTVAQ